MIKKVKIIKSQFSYEFENEINHFIQEHEIIDIKFSISNSVEKYTALIIYIQE